MLRRYNGADWEQVNEIEVGGVNLIAGSAQHAVTGANTYWVAADELGRGVDYTFSVQEVRLDAGSATGATWALVNQNDGTVAQSGTLAFSVEKQIARFSVPDADGNWSLYLYAGLRGATASATVTYIKAKLEEGSIATSWEAAPEDVNAQIEELLGGVTGLDRTLEERVRALIDSMGLEGQFASVEEFLALLNDVELIRSEVLQTDSDLTLTFSRLTTAENNLAQIFSHFEFGDDNGTPYLDMGSSTSSIRMRLTNTRLAFVQAGQE